MTVVEAFELLRKKEQVEKIGKWWVVSTKETRQMSEKTFK